MTVMKGKTDLFYFNRSDVVPDLFGDGPEEASVDVSNVESLPELQLVMPISACPRLVENEDSLAVRPAAERMHFEL